MSKTSQSEYAAAKASEAVRVSGLRRSDGADDIDAQREKIRSGQAFLKVVAYPWGLEFEVCEAGVA